ncbi:MAG: Yip1 family protein, partial [Hyphomonadaceae bacterium]
LEEVEPRRLALRYVAPLAVIPTAAIIVALAVVGVQADGGWVRAPVLGVALSALIFFVMTIAGVFAFAAIINWLAPRFGAEKNYRQAFKLSAYSVTAALVAGVPAAAPALQVFALAVSVYSLYLLFVGAPKVMHPAPKSALNYSIVTTFAAIAVAMVVGAAAMLALAPNASLFPNLPRLPFVDQAQPAQVETTTSADTQARPNAVRPARPVGSDLRGVAPETMAGMARVAVGVERSGQPGQRTLRLEAEYREGARSLTVQVTYSPSIAQVIGFGGVSTSEFNRETSDGYSRRRREGDAIVVEDWNTASQAGSYGRLTQERFYVKASGRGVSADELRVAVDAFDAETLAQFAAES